MQTFSNSTQDGSLNILHVSIILVVIFIVLSTIIGAFFSGQSLSRDQIRVKDVEILRNFLTVYKTNEGIYPASINGQPTNWQKYLDSLPKAPSLDGSCKETQNQYTYKQTNSGQSYSLAFCLGKKQNAYNAGSNLVGP